MTQKIKLCAIQTNSGRNWKENLAAVETQIEEAMAFEPDLISLPEVVNLMDLGNEGVEHFLEECDPSLERYQALAGERCVHIHIGSLGVSCPENPGKQLNRSFLINPEGNVVARYDKIHLFDANVSENESYRESDAFESGNKACLVETSFGKAGLTVCYDLRFPYLFRSLAQEGALVFFAPAAFTVKTGKLHWHSLLRARAIECRAFVIAAAQGGLHQDGRSTFGHSMVVSPEGEIIAELDHDRPGVLCCEIDPAEALAARKRIPNLIDAPFTMEIHQDPDR